MILSILLKSFYYCLTYLVRWTKILKICRYRYFLRTMTTYTSVYIVTLCRVFVGVCSYLLTKRCYHLFIIFHPSYQKSFSPRPSRPIFFFQWTPNLYKRMLYIKNKSKRIVPESVSFYKNKNILGWIIENTYRLFPKLRS